MPTTGRLRHQPASLNSSILSQLMDLAWSVKLWREWIGGPLLPRDTKLALNTGPRLARSALGQSGLFIPYSWRSIPISLGLLWMKDSLGS